MREFTAALAIAAALIATDARAEAWTYTDENGQEQNTDACPKQDCRDNPKPQPPKQIPGAKPDNNPPNLVVDRGGSTTGKPYEQHYGFCCIHEGEPRFHPQWLRDKEQARAQCAAKLVKPVCHKDISAQIRVADAKAAKTKAAKTNSK